MLSADAEQLMMTYSTTLEVGARHTTVNIDTDSANNEFKNVDRGKKDVRFGQEFLPS